MSIVGSMLGRAAAGAGVGLASLATRYLDEESAKNKAQALADIEFANKKRTDEYEQSDARQARMRANATAATVAAGQAADTVALNTAGNSALTQAQIDRTNRVTTGTMDVAAEAAGKTATAQDKARSYDLSPGQKRARDGVTVDENKRPTSQEVQETLYREGLKDGTKKPAVDRMSEAGKVQLQGIERRDGEIQKLIDKGMSEGTLTDKPTTPDGKPNPDYEKYQYLRRQRQELSVARTRLLAGEGVISGSDDGARLLSQQPSPADLEASLKQAQMIGGDYAAEFEAAIRPALDEVRGEPYKRRSIMEAARKFGDKNYDVQIGGPDKDKVRTAAAPAAKPAQEFVPPPDSVVGKHRARLAQEAAAKDEATSQQRQQAAEAFAALQPGDKAAAYRLQSSKLFNFLTSEQQADVYMRVNGR